MGWIGWVGLDGLGWMGWVGWIGWVGLDGLDGLDCMGWIGYVGLDMLGWMDWMYWLECIGWVYYIRLELAVACCFATGPMSLNQHEVFVIYLGKLDIIQNLFIMYYNDIIIKKNFIKGIIYKKKFCLN